MNIEPVLTTLDGVNEETRAFYTEKDGSFVLDVGKYTTAQIEAATTGLKTKNDELISEKRAAAAAKKEAETEVARIAREAAEKNGDLEAYKASVEALRAQDREEWEGKTSSLQSAVEKLTIGNLAKDLAAELAVSGSAAVLERLIAPDLGYEVKDGVPATFFRGPDGKATALTVEDYKAKITSDPAYAPLIAASKGSGGGAANPNGGAGKTQIKRSAYDAMSPPERSKFLKDGGAVADG